jgi:predicted PurR-regulated permease PerM
MSEVDAVFAPPRWLRDLGRMAWLLVGVLLVVVGVIWLLGATYTITLPVVAATIVAVVTLPIVDRLDRHMPRAAAAAIVLVSLFAIAVAVAVIVVIGVKDQSAQIKAQLSKGVDKASTYLTDVGVSQSTADETAAKTKTDARRGLKAIVEGVIPKIKQLASVILGLSFVLLSLFFILKDGPGMQRWIDSHVGLPEPMVHTVTSGVGRSLRGYFRGVTIVAAFNGVMVGLFALILGVPLAGTIAIVSFVTAYVPYIGAFIAGFFAVVIALGAKGTTVALIMLLLFLLANGLLQNIVQPFAMGSALDLNPLVVLVVTIAAGCLFGTLGLILAGPLTSAAVHIPRELKRLSAAET